MANAIVLIILALILILIVIILLSGVQIFEAIKKNTVIVGLLIIAIIMPLIVWLSKFWVDGNIVYQRPYESGWFSFFGSYLGGVLGGVATLIAVVKTIQSNKNEQAEKEMVEERKETQESAFIIYYDFDFALKNIREFLFEFWKMHKTKGISIVEPYNELIFTYDTISIYKECLDKLDQFYFDEDFVHTIAKLHDPSLGIETIREIAAVYGHLSNIKRSMKVSDKMVYKIAFNSMNHLISIKRSDPSQEISRNDFVIDSNIRRIMNTLENTAYNSYKPYLIKPERTTHIDWKKTIKLDADTPPSYGHDHTFATYPSEFPTVIMKIQILLTDELLTFARDDTGRLKRAEFYIGINGFTKNHVNSCITAKIKDEQENINLSEEDREEIWDVVDAQCREVFGKGCEQMLEEAKALI